MYVDVGLSSSTRRLAIVYIAFTNILNALFSDRLNRLYKISTSRRLAVVYISFTKYLQRVV